MHVHPLRSYGSDAFTPPELTDNVMTFFEAGRTYLVDNWGVMQPLRFSLLTGTEWCIMRQIEGPSIEAAAVYPDAAYPFRVMPYLKARISATMFPHPVLFELPADDVRKWSCNTHTHNTITFLVDKENRIYMRYGISPIAEIEELRERQKRSLDMIINNRHRSHPLYRAAIQLG